jgi:hypothetical protein
VRALAAPSVAVVGLFLLGCHRRAAPSEHAANGAASVTTRNAPGAPASTSAAPNAATPKRGDAATPNASAPASASHSLDDVNAGAQSACGGTRVRAPETDRPSADERLSLRDCDAEALYYGIGRPRDYLQARKCAYAQLDGDAPIFGGPGILMMIYANGAGVPRNYDLAAGFACDVGGAPAELEGRLGAIDDMRRGSATKPELDLCDHATSGFMGGACAGHQERIASVWRRAKKAKAIASLPKPELDALERAAKAFFEARTRNEVDLSGTLRAASMFEEQAKLEDAYVSALAWTRTAELPSSDDAAPAEAALNKVYSSLMSCLSPAAQGPAGSVTREGIRTTQRAWLPYRGAWIALGVKARPDTQRDGWRAFITRERVRMLAELGSAYCRRP